MLEEIWGVGTMNEVSNWSGSIRFTPAQFQRPTSAEGVAALLRKARRQGGKIRTMGSGHSSSLLFETRDVLVSLERMSGLVDVDVASRQATLQAGTTLETAGRLLHEHGLALPNLGDIDQQTLAGVIATGTHGTGRHLQNLATMLVGGRFVNAEGELTSFSTDDPELLNSFRVSLGVLGILTEVSLQLVDSHELFRKEWCSQIDDCLPHIDELIEKNRCFDFYWYPRSDRVKLRTMNTLDAPASLPYATRVERDADWNHRVIAQRRELKFEETEFAIPAEAGIECFLKIRDRVKQRHRKNVGWRILYRTVAADSAFLSPAQGRETVTISVLQNASLPSEEYFRDVERIFCDHGGRPHWGKKHNLTAQSLRPLYPRWDDFASVRKRLDPEELFLTPPLRKLLVDE
jgi:FAD/FMN-containing dehydrogenase